MTRTGARSGGRGRKGKAPAGRKKVGARAGRVHLYVGISLDGYIAAPDHGLAWLDPYQDARAGFAPFIKTIGSTIMGRTTYDVAVRRGPVEFGMPAYVITHRPFTPPSPKIVPYGGDLARLVVDIRARHPGDIWLMGGGRVTQAFQEADLIDIWTVAFVPALIGAGLPMFPAGVYAERRLTLVRTHRYPSGVVELRYERRKTLAK